MTMTETLLKSARTHPKVTLAMVLFFPVFFGCFGFPLINFSRILSSHWMISLTPLFTLWVLYDLAVWAAGRFPQWRQWQVWLMLMNLTLMGLSCRLALEWGEVSITTDFTAPNLLIHLGVYGGIFLFGIREAKKYI